MLYAQGGDDILIREGRYSEHVKFNTQATEEKPIMLKPFPGELVIMDGTIPILSDWEPYDNGGYTIYRTQVDSAAIAEIIGMEFMGIHQLFMDGRMMMPAQEVNFKNPMDLSGTRNGLGSTTWGRESNEPFGACGQSRRMEL